MDIHEGLNPSMSMGFLTREHPSIKLNSLNIVYLNNNYCPWCGTPYNNIAEEFRFLLKKEDE